jgi:hypothetical protein
VTNVKLTAVLLLALLLAGSLSAKNIEQNLRWKDLPQSLTGQKITVLRTDKKKVTGTLSRIEENGLVVDRRKGPVTIPRAETSQVETQARTRTRGRIIGTAVGASLGIVLTSIAVKYRNNEGGVNADALVGVAVGVAVGGAVLGFLAGNAADNDRTIIHILPN